MNEAAPAGVRRWSIARLPVPTILIGLGLLAAAIIMALVVADSRNQRLEAIEAERHTYRVLIQTDKVASALQDAETGARSYLLAGDTQFIPMFNAGMNTLPIELAELKALTRDNEPQQDNIDQLQRTTQQRLATLLRGVELATAGNREEAIQLAKPGAGFGSLTSAQALLAEIDQIENELLVQRTAEAQEALRNSDIFVGLMLLLIVAMVVYGIHTLVSAIRSQLQATAFESERDLARQLQEADAAAVRTAALLTVVGDALPDLIYAKDREGRITYANPGTLKAIGKPLDELLGQLTVEYSGKSEEAERIDANDARIMDSGTGEVIDETFTDPDGKTYLFRSTKAPLRNAEGEVIGLAGVSIDVTAERNAVAALKASEERFRTLSDTAPSFIFMTDEAGEITYTNQAFQQYTGKSNDELVGMGWVRTVHRDDRSIPQLAWEKAAKSAEPFSAEYRFRRHDDEFRCFLVRATPVRDPDEGITQWIGICTDIQDAIDARQALEALTYGLEVKVSERTIELNSAVETLQREVAEREAAEAQVRQMQKIESIGQLTGGIAHDFNNMLAVVMGSLDIAKRRLRNDPDRALASIEHAEEGAKRAALLTARLLAFSRQQPLAPEAVDANALVGGMSELLRQTIGEQIEIETVLAGGLWRSYIDAPQLENAIVNLCVNARDAMPDGGKLTIETHNCHLDENYASGHAGVTAGQYVLVCVTDTGSGMSAETSERAFDPFYTTKEVGKGTGLGLSQVFGFVKQSGGHVKIYTEVDEGTTVKLYLPRYFGPAVADADRTVTKAGEIPIAQDGEVVMVVEDDAQVRRVSVQLVRDLGYDVIEASNGMEALERLAKTERLDVILTDIVMPGMTGRVMADEALKMREGLKIVYTTGYTRNAVVHNGVLDPGTEFLAKPYTVAALAGKLRTVLDKT